MAITKAEFDKLIISKTVANTFELADNSSASFLDTLLSEGIGDRETVRVYAMKWAIAQEKYADVSVVKGQRGLKFNKRGSAAEQAVTRILRAVFNSGATGKKQKKAAPAKFTASQRSVCNLFLAEFPGKTLQEQINQARALLKSLEQ